MGKKIIENHLYRFCWSNEVNRTCIALFTHLNSMMVYAVVLVIFIVHFIIVYVYCYTRMIHLYYKMRFSIREKKIERERLHWRFMSTILNHSHVCVFMKYHGKRTSTRIYVAKWIKVNVMMVEREFYVTCTHVYLVLSSEYIICTSLPNQVYVG